MNKINEDIMTRSKIDNLKYLHEYLAKSEETPNFDTMANPGDADYKKDLDWTDKSADQFVYKIKGIKDVFRGPMVQHTYEFDTKNDRFRIADENDIWSTTMASRYRYEIGNLVDRDASNFSSNEATSLNPNKQQVLIIMNQKYKINDLTNLSDDDLESIVGTIDQSGVFRSNPLYNSEIDSDKRPEWLRWTQTVLDWAGLIPVIGDALDIINAAIYFAYGKTFDGVLSLIAVIPVVGSAIALPIKGASKLIQRGVARVFKSVRKTGDLSKGFAYLVEKGLMKPEHIPYLEKGLRDLVAKGKAAAKHPIVPDKLAKEIDEFAELLAKTDAKKIGVIPGEIGFKTAKEALAASKAATKANFWRRFNPLKGDFLKKYTFWPESQVKRIAANLNQDFLTKMINNPDQLAAMIKTSSTRVSNAAADKISKLASQKGMRRVGNLTGTRAIEGDLKFLKQKLSPKEFEILADGIVKSGQRNGSLVWNMYKTNRLNNIKAYANMTDWYKNLQLQNAKWFDVVSNELQDIGYDLGVVNEDNAEGALFYPILSAAVKEYLPGTADSIRAIKDNELMQGTLAAGKALLGYAGEAAGLTDSETYDFDKSYDDEE